ncbi:hypothetical protein [Microcystis phage Mel-JY01]
MDSNNTANIETLKVDVEDLNKANEIRDRYSQIISEIGKAEVEIRILQKRLDSANEYRAKLNDEYDNTAKMETELVSELNTKYGDGIFNLTDGTFVKSPENNDAK